MEGLRETDSICRNAVMKFGRQAVWSNLTSNYNNLFLVESCHVVEFEQNFERCFQIVGQIVCQQVTPKKAA